MNTLLNIFGVRSRKLPVLRWTLFLVPCLLTFFGTYAYMMHEAGPNTPPVGYVFPREPVLVGIYRYEAPGGKIYRTWVGETQIYCSYFSYFSGTLAQVGGYGDCGMKHELHGRSVEVHQVRVPGIASEPNIEAIRIVSDGKTYLDRSDAWVRDRWIRDTRNSAIYAAEMLTLVAGIFSWLATDWIIKRLELRRKK